MTFETVLREKIAKAGFGSDERTLLKVVLGDIQQKSATGKVTDEVCHGIVKKMIESNKQNLDYLTDSHLKSLVKKDKYDEAVILAKESANASDRLGSLSAALVQLGFVKSEQLTPSDYRYQKFQEENQILVELLPQYMTPDQIRKSLIDAGVDVKSQQNDGQATGKAMAHFKSTNAPVEGQTVKEVVLAMRKS